MATGGAGEKSAFGIAGHAQVFDALDVMIEKMTKKIEAHFVFIINRFKILLQCMKVLFLNKKNDFEC